MVLGMHVFLSGCFSSFLPPSHRVFVSGGAFFVLFSFSFFFALIVRLLQAVWAPRALRFFLGFYGLFRRFPFFVLLLHLVVFPNFCYLSS